MVEKICQDALDLSSSTPLKVIFAFKMLLALLATILVTYWSKRSTTCWIPNPNAKVLYRTHLWLCFYASFLFFFLYAFQIIRSSIPSDDPCFYTINARLACIIRMLPVVGVHCQSINMFTFAVERAISTIFSKQYEKLSNSYLGILLVFLSATLALLMDLLCYYFPINENTFVSSLTVRNPDNYQTFQYVAYIALSLELFTITIFVLTYIWNKKKANEAERDSTLGNRYQVRQLFQKSDFGENIAAEIKDPIMSLIEENKKVIRTLLPCFVLHFLLNAFSYCGLSTLPILFSKYNTINLAIFIECIGLSQGYALFMPWLLLCQIRRRYTVASRDAEEITRAHFQQLHRIFNA